MMQIKKRTEENDEENMESLPDTNRESVYLHKISFSFLSINIKFVDQLSFEIFVVLSSFE
jgi:hypothetical protein